MSDSTPTDLCDAKCPDYHKDVGPVRPWMCSLPAGHAEEAHVAYNENDPMKGVLAMWIGRKEEPDRPFILFYWWAG
jgi:hypothetical protein